MKTVVKMYDKSIKRSRDVILWPVEFGQWTRIELIDFKLGLSFKIISCYVIPLVKQKQSKTMHVCTISLLNRKIQSLFFKFSN